MNYLDSQSLDIVFVDDNAPFTGIERGGQGVGNADIRDMIGKCSIPLKDLLKGISINGDFDIKGQNGERSGKVKIKISIVDPSKSSAKNRGIASQDIKD